MIVAAAVPVFDAATHTSRLPNGLWIPHVTAVLAAVGVATDFDDLAALSPWMDERIRAACARGTAVHADCHAYDDDDLDWTTVDPRVLPYVEAWAACRRAKGLVPITHARERLVYHPLYQYAGILDGIFAWKRQRVLIDIKTGDPEDAAAHLQTAAYCLTPGHKVLTRELNWVPVESLRVGDGLWTCTEHARGGGGHGGSRAWMPSRVLVHEMGEVEETIMIRLESGVELTSTLEHPWLTSRLGVSRQQWTRAQDLTTSHSLVKAVNLWDCPQSYEQGWLAGIMDGEGTIAIRKGKCEIMISQNEGVVAERIRHDLVTHGIDYREHGRSGVIRNFHLTGGLPAILPVLGAIRPVRLLQRADIGGIAFLAIGHDRVVGARLLGRQTIVRLSTSSGTYLADGYVAHNSAAWDQEHPGAVIHARWAVQLVPGRSVPFRVVNYTAPTRTTAHLDFPKFLSCLATYNEQPDRRAKVK